MSSKRYSDEFKIEAVRQITERGHSVADVAIRRGVTTYSLYQWRKRFGKAPAQQSTELEPHAEIRRSKAEMRQVTEKRFIRKKAAAYFAKG